MTQRTQTLNEWKNELDDIITLTERRTLTPPRRSLIGSIGTSGVDTLGINQLGDAGSFISYRIRSPSTGRGSFSNFTSSLSHSFARNASAFNGKFETKHTHYGLSAN
jgi:hypothetical protein